ncbi:alpha/beta hydrolase [Nocardia sp. NPDC059177]|uniref:alpha/beta hydrolase n=1 Tax=Nocardia sp. NPDC059177 TaxID=3346759 RepID=UPI0036AECD7C
MPSQSVFRRRRRRLHEYASRSPAPSRLTIAGGPRRQTRTDHQPAASGACQRPAASVCGLRPEVRSPARWRTGHWRIRAIDAVAVSIPSSATPIARLCRSEPGPESADRRVGPSTADSRRRIGVGAGTSWVIPGASNRSLGEVLTDSARQSSETSTATPTFVFVHGLASNSFFWMPLVRELALLGHRSLAVDLPGHGLDARIPLSYQAPQDLPSFTAGESPMAGTTVADNVGHVIDVVRQVRRYGPVVLVGHSLGGITIGLVANAIPDAVQRLVYVSAFCPSTPEAPSAMALATTPEATQGIPAANPDHSLFLGLEAVPPGIIRFNLRSADPTAIEDFRRINMPDATPEQALTLINYTMQPEDSAHTQFADARVDAETWGRIPRSYIRLTRDKVLSSALVTKMITDADRLTPDNPFDVHTLPTGHVDLALHSAELAAVLDKLA